MPKGPGRFALRSAQQIQHGQTLINKNIQQVTFNGHSSKSNNELKTKPSKHLSRSKQSKDEKTIPEFSH